jgi:hypothetical protein
MKYNWMTPFLFALLALTVFVALGVDAKGADWCYAETSCNGTQISCQVDGPECTAERGDGWVKCFGVKEDGARGEVKAECPETK